MGRDYYFVEVERNAEHDVNKICVKMNYEPDEDVLDNILEQCYPGCSHYEITGEQRNQMCHLCTWYLDPVVSYLSVEYESDEYRNTIVKSTHHVRHCYHKSPSSYFFKDVLDFGKLDNTFKHDGGGVYLIHMRDVVASEERLENMGEPKRQSDIDACAETKKILEYLRECCQKDNVNVYFFDEY